MSRHVAWLVASDEIQSLVGIPYGLVLIVEREGSLRVERKLVGCGIYSLLRVRDVEAEIVCQHDGAEIVFR